MAVLEKDISFGGEGTVFTNVCSALYRAGLVVPALDFVGGLGGDDITEAQVETIFARLKRAAAGECGPVVSFCGIDDGTDAAAGEAAGAAPAGAESAADAAAPSSGATVTASAGDAPADAEGKEAR